MKLIPILFCSLLALSAFAYATSEPQVFPTSAGPVKITPLNHASTLIEAGGKTIYLDPAKPANFVGTQKLTSFLLPTFTATTWTRIRSRKSARRKPRFWLRRPWSNRHQRQAHCEWRNQNLAGLDH